MSVACKSMCVCETVVAIGFCDARSTWFTLIIVFRLCRLRSKLNLLLSPPALRYVRVLFVWLGMFSNKCYVLSAQAAPRAAIPAATAAPPVSLLYYFAVECRV